MEKFEIKTSVRFGADALGCLTELTASKLFIVTDPFMVESKMVERVTSRLAGRQYKIYSDVVPDPSLELVIKGIGEVSEFRPDAVIALGGGSVIDEAKAIMHFAKQMGNLPDIPFIAIPTTSGTGSEVTSFAVITDQTKGIKYPLVDPGLLPDIAVLDADLVKSVPTTIVADTGMDVLTHALEAYVSKKANSFTDGLAEKAVRLVFQYLVRSFQNGEDREAREQMHLASCIAGLSFDQTSLGVNHAIAHNIGGKFKIPHGRANAILLPFVIEYNANISGFSQKEYNAAAEKYAEIARLTGFGGSNVRAGVKNLVQKIRKMQRQLTMPVSFKKCGIKLDLYQKMEEELVTGALADGCIATNPRIVCREDVQSILKQAYQGISNKEEGNL